RQPPARPHRHVPDRVALPAIRHLPPEQRLTAPSVSRLNRRVSGEELETPARFRPELARRADDGTIHSVAGRPASRAGGGGRGSNWTRSLLRSIGSRAPGWSPAAAGRRTRAAWSGRPHPAASRSTSNERQEDRMRSYRPYSRAASIIHLTQ